MRRSWRSRRRRSAGLDIITDGEIRRESYSNRFATALDGVDLDNPGRRSIAAVIPIRCRVWSDRSAAATPVEVERSGVPAPPHAAARQGHGAGPFTMAQQAQIDFYGGSRRARRDGLCGRGQRRDSRSVQCRRRRRADRRALHAGAPEEARAVRPARRSIARSRASAAPPRCTSASATRPSFIRGPSGYSFLSELAECSCRQVSIETAQSNLDCAVLTGLPDKKIILGVIDLSTNEVEIAGAGRQRASGARCRSSMPPMSSSRPTAA